MVIQKANHHYFRNSTTAFNSMKSVATTKSPKEVVTIMTNKGGELYASPSDVPKNRQQIIIHCKQKEKQCKLAEGSSDEFVQDVKAAPSPQSVLLFIGK